MAVESCTLLIAVLLCTWQVYQGRHLHRDVAVKVLPLDGGLAKAVQREVQQDACGPLYMYSDIVFMHHMDAPLIDGELQWPVTSRPSWPGAECKLFQYHICVIHRCNWQSGSAETPM